MRVSNLAMFVICLTPLATFAASPVAFPYKAVVQKDGEIVRSGPGERYDPTLKLPAGTEVTVNRHDPGGWFVIDPPVGSFSWIDAQYVETSGDGRGVVKAPSQAVAALPPQVFVWIGSEFTDEHRFSGAQLRTGDEVTIIGEAVHQTDRGPVKFYKIEPPRQEHRWIKGDYVISLDAASNVAQQNFGQPPSLPTSGPAGEPPVSSALQSGKSTSSPGFPVEQGPSLLERELNRAVDSKVVVKAGPPPEELEAARRQLFELDEQLQSMLSQGPGQWRLEEMEQAYRMLQTSTTPGVAGMIDARLQTIESRKAIRAEYDAFVAITARTDQRDAELLSLQNGTPYGVPVSTNAVQLGPPQPVDGAAPVEVPSPSGSSPSPQPGPVTLGGIGPAPPVEPAGPVDLSRLDGAGIVTRAPGAIPGMPQHVLVAPDGRLLAYLQAGQGINLDAYLGQSVGVVGRRSQERSLRSDLIIVQQLTPVRLQP